MYYIPLILIIFLSCSFIPTERAPSSIRELSCNELGRKLFKKENFNLQKYEYWKEIYDLDQLPKNISYEELEKEQLLAIIDISHRPLNYDTLIKGIRTSKKLNKIITKALNGKSSAEELLRDLYLLKYGDVSTKLEKVLERKIEITLHKEGLEKIIKDLGIKKNILKKVHYNLMDKHSHFNIYLHSFFYLQQIVNGLDMFPYWLPRLRIVDTKKTADIIIENFKKYGPEKGREITNLHFKKKVLTEVIWNKFRKFYNILALALIARSAILETIEEIKKLNEEYEKDQEEINKLKELLEKLEDKASLNDNKDYYGSILANRLSEENNYNDEENLTLREELFNTYEIARESLE